LTTQRRGDPSIGIIRQVGYWQRARFGQHEMGVHQTQPVLQS